MSSRKPLLLVVAAGLVCVLCGCQMAQLNEVGPQSHFAYPNSNVKALGPVRVTERGPTTFLAPPTIKTGELDAALYNKAISQVAGANMVIDYVRTTKLYSDMIIPIYWTELELEGTAAKMEVGKQELR